MLADTNFSYESELSEQVRKSFFIDGRWVNPSGNKKLDLISPVTETLMLQTPEASEQDVDNAVKAARRAFDEGPWPRLSAAERGKYIGRIADELRKREPLLARVWTAQVGAPQSFTNALTHVGIDIFEYYAKLAEKYEFEQERTYPGGVARVVNEPVGVVGVITPWNSPLILMSYKVAAALAAGCTIVAKPSPETPLEAQILAECVEAAGLPPGVFNIVPGGREIGDYLVRRPGIDKVSFTGSTAAGKAIAATCADRLARVGLELGGKSAAIIMDDADISLALKSIVPYSMPFSGQICFSLTRILVSRKNRDALLEAYVGAVQALKVGDPSDLATQVGPLSMKRQLERVQQYVAAGKAEGATLVTGGGDVPGFDRGYFIQPTVFSDVTSDMTIAREEIFGPVVSVMTYEDEDDALRIANSTSYGLSGAIYTADAERGYGLARRVRSGNVSVNGLSLSPAIPFGGFKQSGIGREGGVEGLESYLECKAVYMPG
jgi:acyl-CoA reductase-like NAD-dependent aldehyde dehydrogenase